MTNTTTTTIDNLSKDQTIVLHTPTGNHILLAKPLFNVLYQYFPNASFDMLNTLISNNAAYGLHIAKQHNLFSTFAVADARSPDKNNATLGDTTQQNGYLGQR